MTTRIRLQFWLLFLACMPLASLGCTAVQLRRSTVQQSMTLSDIYTQQVVNNLAKFIQDPAALPYFSFPNQGTTAIEDTGSLGGPGYLRTDWVTNSFGFGVGRSASQNWVLVPVSDPAKLGLMRCAYQQAIAPCLGIDYGALSACPDCNDMRIDFHGVRGRKDKTTPDTVELPCLNSSSCWLCWGCRQDVPKDCTAPYVGCYGDLYVWVPLEGRDMLTRLTLAILDYAVNDSVQFSKRTKSVELKLDKNGALTSEEGKVSKTITVEIPIDQSSDAVVALENYGEFLRRFGNDMAGKLIQHERNHLTEQHKINGVWQGDWDDSKVETNLDQEHWNNLDIDSYSSAEPELRKAAEFVRDHKLIPNQIPKDYELLNGPALYQRKGTASAGLQRVAEQLKAASP